MKLASANFVPTKKTKCRREKDKDEDCKDFHYQGLA